MVKTPLIGLQERLNFISGFENDFTLEHRVYNTLAFAIVVFSILGALSNLFFGVHLAATLLAFLGACISLTLYYVSRFRRYFTPGLIFVMIFLAIVVLSAVFPFDAGSQGPLIFLIIALINVFIIISPEKWQLPVLFIWLVSVSALYIYEYKNIDWVVSYPSRLSRYSDLIITFTYSLVVMTLTIITFKRSYNRERAKVLLQNEELSRKNQQIEILMKELNHRVKNNLQVVTSLLNLQSARIEDPQARNAVLDGRNRLLSMVLIHQKLYQTERPTEINMNEYLVELANNIVIANRSVTYENFVVLNIENISFRMEYAVPIGLIVNELITNAVKHAFEIESGDDRLRIYFYKVGDDFMLTVSDNGKGYSRSLKESFGLQLVRSLVDQLDGTIKIVCRNGIEINIEFKTYHE